jgi:hypothetical protein
MSAANVKPRSGGRSHKGRFSNRMLDATVAFVKAASEPTQKKVAA